MNAFDFYYLLSSDLLNVANEKYVLYYIYKYALKKTDFEIKLILHGVRFNFVSIHDILDLVRDHPTIR